MNKHAKQSGFTLLEMMVASFIFAVAVAAMLKVMGESANNLSHIEKQQFALLSAHNQLALTYLNKRITSGKAENGGYQFDWKLTLFPTEDSRINRVQLSIQDSDGSRQLVQLNGFRGQ